MQLTTGETVTADEAYVRESILNPGAKVVAGYQNIMPTFQGQVTEEDCCSSSSTSSRWPSSRSATRAWFPVPGALTQQRIVNSYDYGNCTRPRDNYLTHEYGVKSWLLTQDHKRIALLYLAAISFFFFLGGIFATVIRLELLTPPGDLVSAQTYNKLFTLHGVIMVFLFLIPSIPATLGNFLVPMMIGCKDLAFPKLNLLSWYIFMVGGALRAVRHARWAASIPAGPSTCRSAPPTRTLTSS